MHPRPYVQFAPDGEQTAPTLNSAGELRFVDLLPRGLLPYEQGLSLQHELHSRRVQGQIPDTILFLEHSPVISMGKRGQSTDVLAPTPILEREGVEIHHSERGGQVTYHGPGQLVVYCIVDLRHRLRQIRDFVHGLEQAFVDYLGQRYGVRAWIEDEFPGIWIEQGKVAALGISVKDRVTMHGVALNLHTTMEHFGLIVPCGIRHRSPVSLAQAGLHPDSLHEAARAIAPLLAKQLGYATWEFSSLD